MTYYDQWKNIYSQCALEHRQILNVYDGDENLITSDSDSFGSSEGIDFTILTTSDAFPSMTNTDESKAYIMTDRTVNLTLEFEEGCDFSFSEYDPYNGFHGEGLFFDPYLYVKNNDEIVSAGDVRMLTVPVDWMWPEEQKAIWNVYDDIEKDEEGSPSFSPNWWEVYNDSIYDMP